MNNKTKKTRKKSAASKVKKALINLKNLPLQERIQLLVEAKLMTQEEADQAKQKVSESAQQS